MGIENTEPEYVTGICPSCHQAGLFKRVHIQEGYRDENDYSLYSCFTCESTVSERRIEKVREFK